MKTENVAEVTRQIFRARFRLGTRLAGEDLEVVKKRWVVALLG